MEALYLWPDRPLWSLLVLWAITAVLLWAARDSLHQVLRQLAEYVEHAFQALAQWCDAGAEERREEARHRLLAAGRAELDERLGHEIERLDDSFSTQLRAYSGLQRKLDEGVTALESDYEGAAQVPPQAPGWTSAVETVSNLPTAGDPNVQKILDGIHKSLKDAEKRALQAHRDDSARRHKVLSGMMPTLKSIKGLVSRMGDAVGRCLDVATRVDRILEQRAELRDEEAAVRALTYSAVKHFLVSILVMGVALGGAYINFQLIALPMAELVPSGARLGGVPVSTVAALIIVLMEVTVGMFLLDMLGITELFPRLARIPRARRRLILSLSLVGLFLLASVESSLAVLREHIVEAETALKLSLAGPGQAVAAAETSRIPVVGQAVLGFVLPWILALVAVPLEMFLESGRHVVSSLVAWLLSASGRLARLVGHVLELVLRLLPGVVDVYVAVPLRVEALVRGHRGGAARTSPAPRERVA